MILRTIVLSVLVWFTAPAFALEPDIRTGSFASGPDSQWREGVPRGRLEGPFEFRSEIFTGTVRRYWVFVPDQYDPAVAASLLVFQDGSNDLDNEWGDWFLANRQLVKALNYANRAADDRGAGGPRYAEKQVWTDGGHSDRHGGSMLPEALRGLWN